MKPCGPGIFFSFFFFFFNPHPKTFFSLLLEREETRERNIDVREKYQCARERSINWLLLIYTWTRGHTHLCPNPQPKYIPWPEIKPATFRLCDNTPINCATPPGVFFVESFCLLIFCFFLNVGICVFLRTYPFHLLSYSLAYNCFYYILINYFCNVNSL